MQIDGARIRYVAGEHHTALVDDGAGVRPVADDIEQPAVYVYRAVIGEDGVIEDARATSDVEHAAGRGGERTINDRRIIEIDMRARTDGADGARAGLIDRGAGDREAATGRGFDRTAIGDAQRMQTERKPDIVVGVDCAADLVVESELVARIVREDVLVGADNPGAGDRVVDIVEGRRRGRARPGDFVEEVFTGTGEEVDRAVAGQRHVARLDEDERRRIGRPVVQLDVASVDDVPLQIEDSAAADQEGARVRHGAKGRAGVEEIGRADYVKHAAARGREQAAGDRRIIEIDVGARTDCSDEARAGLIDRDAGDRQAAGGRVLDGPGIGDAQRLQTERKPGVVRVDRAGRLIVENELVARIVREDVLVGADNPGAGDRVVDIVEGCRGLAGPGDFVEEVFTGTGEEVDRAVAGQRHVARLDEDERRRIGRPVVQLDVAAVDDVPLQIEGSAGADQDLAEIIDRIAGDAAVERVRAAADLNEALVCGGQQPALDRNAGKRHNGADPAGADYPRRRLDDGRLRDHQTGRAGVLDHAGIADAYRVQR